MQSLKTIRCVQPRSSSCSTYSIQIQMEIQVEIKSNGQTRTISSLHWENPLYFNIKKFCKSQFWAHTIYEINSASAYESIGFSLWYEVFYDPKKLKTDICESRGEGFQCSDSQGSYECICKDGYESTYDSTYATDGQCNDIDECELGTHACPENSECSNFSGESNCISCGNCILVTGNFTQIILIWFKNLRF